MIRNIKIALFATALAGVVVLLLLRGVNAAGFILLVRASLVSCSSSGIMDMSNTCNDGYVLTVIQ